MMQRFFEEEQEQQQERCVRLTRLMGEGRVARYRLTGEELTGLLLSLTAERQAREQITIVKGLPADTLFVRMALDDKEQAAVTVLLYLAHEDFPSMQPQDYRAMDSCFDMTLTLFAQPEEAVA